MHVSNLVVMVAALAAGSAARAQSTVPCDFVDDFCVAPSGSVACAAAPVTNSEWVVTTRSFIPGDFVNDFGAEAESGKPGHAGACPHVAFVHSLQLRGRLLRRGLRRSLAFERSHAMVMTSGARPM